MFTPYGLPSVNVNVGEHDIVAKRGSSEVASWMKTLLMEFRIGARL